MTAHGSASFLSRVGRPKAPPPKEKFASIMEGVFDGTLAGLARKPAEFWDELFLLGCNARALTELVASSTPDTLHRRREEITTLCQRASERIDDGALLRRSRALELLCVLLLQIARAPFPERSLGVIDTCAGGQESCDAFFADLISRCAACAANHDLPVALRRLAVRCMLTVVCAVDDNVNRNALVRYFMTDDVYEPVMKVLIAPVDVPGGGVSSETHEDATALAHGAGGFGPGAREGDRNGDETEDRRRARKGAALGTTKERSMLREEAGCLLALLLSWRETRNAYTLRLSDADGVEMSVILRAVCSMLAAPARGEDSNERAAAAAAHADGLTADAGAWVSSITANVAAAVRGAREPDDLMGDLARRLGFDDDDAAGGDDGSRGWELGPGPCAALLLLHAVVRDSGLLRKPAIWLELTPKPDEMLHGVPVGQRWREALGRVLCFIRVLCRGRRRRRMRRDEPGGGARSLPAGVTVHTVIGEVTAEEEQGWWDWITGAAAAASPYKLSSTRRRLGKWVGTGSRGTGRWIENDGETADEELAASTALLAVSLLRALLDDASAAEFLHAVDARRLAPEKKSHPERTEETEGTSADLFSLASSLGAALGLPGGARESAASSSVRGSPPVASAVLELLSSVLAEGAPGWEKLDVPRRRRIARRLRHSPRAGDAGGEGRALAAGSMGAPVARADVHAAAVRGRRRRRVGVSARRGARLAVRKLDQFRVGEAGRVVPERRRRRAARERDQGGGERVGRDRARRRSERVPRGRGGRRVDGQASRRTRGGRRFSRRGQSQGGRSHGDGARRAVALSIVTDRRRRSRDAQGASDVSRARRGRARRGLGARHDSRRRRDAGMAGR